MARGVASSQAQQQWFVGTSTAVKLVSSRMRLGGHGHPEVVPSTVQAAIAIVAFFAAAFGLAATLKSLGTPVFVVVVTMLLTIALILQAVSESQWPAYAALALALLAVVARVAFETAMLNDDRRSRRR
jgi:hypothetical protein